MSPTRNLVVLVFLSLLGCSSNDFLLKPSDSTTDRSPASVPEQEHFATIDLGLIPLTNPCTPLRYDMKSESMQVAFMRCNVVLNPQVNPEANFAIREADLCFAVSTLQDIDRRNRSRSELGGAMTRVDRQKPKINQRITIISSRITDDPFGQPSGLDFSQTAEGVHIQDRAPASEKFQSIKFDRQRNTLNYSLYRKEKMLWGVTDQDVDEINVQLKCQPDIIYQTPESNPN